jgi:hypothetical protein
MMQKVLMLILLGGWIGLGCAGCSVARSTDRITPSPPIPLPDPLLPTIPSTAEPAAVDSPPPFLSLPDDPPVGRERFGVGVPLEAGGALSDYPIEQLGIGWYLNWQVERDPPRPGGIAFWQMIRVSEEGYRPGAETIRAAARANPGSVWIIGNEPDVAWQDNTTPEQYAHRYGELYRLLKAADPTCRVAVGGVSQPTPLRLAYLDRVLSAYRDRYGTSLPADLWSVHNFVLREEHDSWGVGIPPGVNAGSGALYEIADHDDLTIFQDQLLDFRRWMAKRGYRERPLVVSEWGILMPPDYGFDQARVAAFMHAAFDLFVTAADEQVGYPGDENRLVQRWAWYSLADTVYPTGNLFDPETKAVTPLGAAFANYAPTGAPEP